MNLRVNVGTRIVGAASRPRPGYIATGRWILRAATVGIVAVLSVNAGEMPRPFLFLKTGEKFATQETAGPTVAELTAYVGDKAGTKFEPRVMNDPVKAAEFCGANKPAAGIVTPGFYLQYAKALSMEPLLETKRTGVKEERYVLVVRKDASDDLAKLTGKTIATPLANEERYVISVVLHGKLGEEVRLKQVNDVEGAVFDLVEDVSPRRDNVPQGGTKNAADAVLMDVGSWALFKDDPELSPKLKVVYQSEELPRDLVVTFGPKNDALNSDRMKSALKEMTGNDQGKKILASIRVESFVDIDKARLSQAQALFYGK